MYYQLCVPQATTHTSFLISGVRGQVLSTVHVPGGAGGSGMAAPKVSPSQQENRTSDRDSLLIAQVHVSRCIIYYDVKGIHVH